METRKIKVTDDTFSIVHTLDSNAETLLDLKNEMRDKGINYDGKEFIEGRSRTKLISDDSTLPKEVIFKGQLTNELTIILMTPDKKVSSSAMSRKEVYAKVKKLDLGEKIKEEYERNFTQVSTSELEKFLKEYGDEEEEEFEDCGLGDEDKEEVAWKEEEVESENKSWTGLKSVVRDLIHILKSDCTIDGFMADNLLHRLEEEGEEREKSPKDQESDELEQMKEEFGWIRNRN